MAEPAESKPVRFVDPGAGTNWTPNQLRELQDTLNEQVKDMDFRIIVLPPGSRVVGE